MGGELSAPIAALVIDAPAWRGNSSWCGCSNLLCFNCCSYCCSARAATDSIAAAPGERRSCIIVAAHKIGAAGRGDAAADGLATIAHDPAVAAATIIAGCFLSARADTAARDDAAATAASAAALASPAAAAPAVVVADAIANTAASVVSVAVATDVVVALPLQPPSDLFPNEAVPCPLPRAHIASPSHITTLQSRNHTHPPHTHHTECLKNDTIWTAEIWTTFGQALDMSALPQHRHHQHESCLRSWCHTDQPSH